MRVGAADLYPGADMPPAQDIDSRLQERLARAAIARRRAPLRGLGLEREAPRGSERTRLRADGEAMTSPL